MRAPLANMNIGVLLVLIATLVSGLSSKRSLWSSHGTAKSSPSNQVKTHTGNSSASSKMSLNEIWRPSRSPSAVSTISSWHLSPFPSTPSVSFKDPTKRSLKIPVYLLILLPKSTKFLFSIQRVTPAISLATENVSASQLLTRHRLVTLYADSKCHIAEAMNEAIKFYIEGEY